MIRILVNTLHSDSQLEAILPRWEHLAMSRATVCHGRLAILESHGESPETPLSNPRCTEEPPVTKSYLAPNVSSAKLRSLLWLHNKMKTKIMELKESNLCDTVTLLKLVFKA